MLFRSVREDLQRAFRDDEARQAGLDPSAVEASIAERLAARRDKRWAESDRLRDALAAMGVELKDNKDGTTSWTVGRRGTA